MKKIALQATAFLFSIAAHAAGSDVILGPGETVQVGDEIIACESGREESDSQVDLDCMKYLHATNNNSVPNLPLFRDWMDSCRNVPVRNPITPRTCTVTDGKVNYECLTYARSLYPGVNSHILMELQLECKDLVLKCSSF